MRKFMVNGIKDKLSDLLLDQVLLLNDRLAFHDIHLSLLFCQATEVFLLSP